MDESKYCTKCETTKPRSDFHRKSKAKDGLQHACKECNKAKVKGWQQDNPDYWLTQNNRSDRISKQKRARKYGLTVEEVEALLVSTTVCQICGREVNLYIDHCHETGRVRGLLCLQCNTSLGNFNDDVALLHRAIEYLSK